MQRYWPTLFLLAAIWGASYLFIKVALEDIQPAPMMAFRGLVAGLILLVYLAATRGAGRAYARAPRKLEAVVRAGRDQRCDPLLARRVG